MTARVSGGIYEFRGRGKKEGCVGGGGGRLFRAPTLMLRPIELYGGPYGSKLFTIRAQSAPRIDHQ